MYVCVCAGVWPMWCSDALNSLSLAFFPELFISRSVETIWWQVLLRKLLHILFQFPLTFYFWLCAAYLCCYLDKWKNTDRMVSSHACLFCLPFAFCCYWLKSQFLTIKKRPQFQEPQLHPILNVSYVKPLLKLIDSLYFYLLYLLSLSDLIS